jgi:hypothetical protein
MKSIAALAQKYWSETNTAHLYLHDEEQSFLVCTALYYLISNEVSCSKSNIVIDGMTLGSVA